VRSIPASGEVAPEQWNGQSVPLREASTIYIYIVTTRLSSPLVGTVGCRIAAVRTRRGTGPDLLRREFEPCIGACQATVEGPRADRTCCWPRRKVRRAASYARPSLPFFKYAHHVCDFPQSIRDARRHCWRQPMRFMQLTEVIVDHEERDRVGVVLQLF
jgi:hypothetical protein